MKKATIFLLLLTVLTALLCVGALAAEPAAAAGIYGVSADSGITIMPDGSASEVLINGQTVSDFHAGAEKLTVSYDAAVKDEFYFLLVTDKATDAPTVADIVYIDQQTAGDSGVSFVAFPSSLSQGEYYVYLSSSADEGVGSEGLAMIGSFAFYQPYKLGDVDGSGRITAGDALSALQMAVGSGIWENWQINAADVDFSGRVTAGDALDILQAAVGLKIFD